MVEFARKPECRVAALCRHFGETRPGGCGHCTFCLTEQAAEPSATAVAGRRPDSPADRAAPPLDEAIIAQARAVRRENPLLADPTAMARWLCGITSPALTRAKLSSHPLFGALAEQPYPRILARFEAGD